MARDRNIFLLVCLLIVSVLALIHIKNQYELPKIIWMFWDNDDPPTLIKKIQQYNCRRLDGWHIQMLNIKNLHMYIKPEDYPINYEKIELPQHKSDWIRLFLLSKYGGCWLDASIIINDPYAIDRLYEESKRAKSQFTGFKLSKKQINNIPV